ncbi:NHL repeat-containing protein 3-like [Ptychodera flava]|uniref:NHL repeat-containing protein 3-like n=1 Tax=Ptychodera flava TaxID=63121 RepID=UPI003969E581
MLKLKMGHRATWNVLLISFLVTYICQLCCSSAPLYVLDPLWPKEPSLFKGQIFSAAVDHKHGEVFITQRGDGLDPVLVFSEDGEYKRSFHRNISVIDTIHGSRMHYNTSSKTSDLWLTDIGNASLGHTVKRFSSEGKILSVIGTPGKAGTSLRPLQFDHVADIVFGSQGEIYIADGDGGLNNRIMKLNKDFGLEWYVEGSGSSPGKFNIPHSIEVDHFGQIWVADRKNNRTQLFDSKTGDYLGEWTECFKTGQPYAIRMSADKSHFIILQLQENRILFVSSPTSPGNPGDCHVIGQIQMAPDLKPHLLAVNQDTGSFYVAEIGGDACQRYVPFKG